MLHSVAIAQSKQVLLQLVGWRKATGLQTMVAFAAAVFPLTFLPRPPVHVAMPVWYRAGVLRVLPAGDVAAYLLPYYRAAIQIIRWGCN
jgi:hypothetical protein